MTSQLSTIICVIFGVVSWYYFNKYLETQKEFTNLHKRLQTMNIDNQKMKSRIKDLQSYKNDVSKTFQILDNELILINDHLRNQQPIQATIQTSQSNIPSTISSSRIPITRVSSFTSLHSGNNVSLLTPELLTSLFNMNSEDIYNNSLRFNSQRPMQNNDQTVQHNIPVQQEPITVQQEPITVQQEPITVQQEPITIQQTNIQQNVELKSYENKNFYNSKVYDDKVYDDKVYDDKVYDDKDNEKGIEMNIDRANRNMFYDISHSGNSHSGNSYDQYLLNNNND